MIDSTMDKLKEKEFNKEEGEITDDEDFEILGKEYTSNRRSYEKPDYFTNSKNLRTGSKRVAFMSPSIDTVKNIYSSSGNYHGQRIRAFQDSTRGNSPSGRSYRSESPELPFRGPYSSRSERHGNNYRDYHGQRERHYVQHSPMPNRRTPNSERLTVWRQKKFYSSSRNDSQSETAYSRHQNEGCHQMDKSVQPYHSRSDRGETDSGLHYSRSSSERSFRMTAEMEDDYNNLLKLHAKVQEEMNLINRGGHDTSNSTSDTHFDDGNVLNNTAAPKNKFSSDGVHLPGSDLEQKSPTMRIAEAVSDVSSDEMDFFSLENEQGVASPAYMPSHSAVSMVHLARQNDGGGSPAASPVSLDVSATDGGAVIVIDSAEQDSELQVSTTQDFPPSQEETEEEDLNVLELRRIALESAAWRRHGQRNENEGVIPVSSHSSSNAASSVKNSCSDTSQTLATESASAEIVVEVNKVSDHLCGQISQPSSAVLEVSICPPESRKQNASVSGTVRLGQRRHSLEPKAESRSRPCKESSRMDTSKSRDSELKNSSRRTKKGDSKEKENSRSRSRTGKVEEVTSGKPRPLPFAPVRLEKITLKSYSPRSSILTNAARRVQRRARQSSVARQLPRKSSASSSTSISGHRDRWSAHRSSNGADSEKKIDERRQEISKILSLKDQKEQVIRFLKLISYKPEGSTSTLKVTPKLPSTTDNYEEVEMDIDSGDDVEDNVKSDDSQKLMQSEQAMVSLDQTETNSADMVSCDPFGMQNQWIAPYIPTPVNLFTNRTPFLIPPPPPLQPLPPLPPLVEEIVPPPPPPLPDEPPPPPPPPSTLLDEERSASPENSIHSDEKRISNIAQYFKDAIARQESVQKTVSTEDASSHVAVESCPSEQSSPAVKKSGEDTCNEQNILSCSPSTTLPEKVPPDNDDDDDEDVMREQLLRDLKIRRREMAEGKGASASSKDSSPTASLTASPQHVMVTKPVSVPTRKVHKHQPKQMLHMEFPVHKPVVVQLRTDDSSSEDEDRTDAGGAAVSDFDIDSFLKAQRKSAENHNQQATPMGKTGSRTVELLENQDTRLQQERRLKQKEVDLSNLKRSALSYRLSLKKLTVEMNQHLEVRKSAEVRVAQLKKQLVHFENLVAKHALLANSSKEQMERIKDRLQRKLELIASVTEDTMNLGCKLLGPGYTLGSCPTPHPQDLKRQLQVSVTVQPAPSKKKKQVDAALNDSYENKLSPKGPHGDSAQEDRYALLQRQKAQLEGEIQAYRQRIQQYQKKEQLSISINTEDNHRSVIENTMDMTKEGRDSSRSHRLPSLESIKLEPVDKEDGSSVTSRRRSLLDLTKSPKPTLVITQQHTLQNCSQGSSTLVESRNKGSIDFKMPSGSQLSTVCKIQREKVKEVLSTPSRRTPDLLSNLNFHCSPIKGLKVVLPGSSKDMERDTDVSCPRSGYTSSLLHFRAYRFSPYYRTKAGLTLSSATYTHKLNPNRVLCRYDIQGTCNDQHCTWQHSSDYKLSDREILMDLVAYCPQLAGVTPDTPVSSYADIIGDYVDRLLSQHKGKMTTDDLCLLLTSKVNDAADHVRPYTMFYDHRPWRPSPNESSTFSLSVTSQFQTADDVINGLKPSDREVDSVVDVDDVRYFVVDKAGEGDIQDMEGAVIATPKDTQLWLRLAYSKLSNPARSNEERLRQALNVLSRGLEKNKDSTALWVHYLSLFQRHPDSDKELINMCQMALACAPCYDIWWMLLEASCGFHAKDEVCNNTLSFLCEESKKVQAGEEQQQEIPPVTQHKLLSHHMLEMLLYKVSLSVQSGRFKTALHFLQAVVGMRDSRNSEMVSMKALTHADQCVLWICMVHLVEFRTLPSSLYDPANQKPGRIRSKEQLYIPWQSKAKLASSLEPHIQCYVQAMTQGLDGPQDCSSPQYVMAVHNLADLLCHQGKHLEMCRILTQILQSAPHLDDLWLLLADIYAGCEDFTKSRQVLVKAMTVNKYSAKLHYHSAHVDMVKDNVDQALEQLEQFVLRFFHISPEEGARADPNLFYSKLLGLEVPVHKVIPCLKEDVSELAADRNVHFWLCYCLLLELQGECGVVINMYETALSSTTDAADLCQLWKCYVQFLYRYHQRCGPVAAQGVVQQLQEAMMRSVVTAPTVVPDPFPRQHQSQPQHLRDFTHLTALVTFYMDMIVPDIEAPALDTFLGLMPDNVPLLIRCVEKAVKDGQTRRALSLCTRAVFDKVANLHLWKLILALAQQEETPKEVERLYVRAVTAMPLSVSLWKDFLLFEVSQENPVAINTILAQCQSLGLNIQGYVSTISSSTAS